MPTTLVFNKADLIEDEEAIQGIRVQFPGSFVVSRGTAFSYKGRLADARQIGRELEVSYLLTGSVLPEGQRVRVNTELADTSDGPTGDATFARITQTINRGLLGLEAANR